MIKVFEANNYDNYDLGIFYFDDKFNEVKNDIIIYGGRDFVTKNEITNSFYLLDDNDMSKLDFENGGGYTLNEVFNIYERSWATKCILINLKYKTGKDWFNSCFKGYSQSDWCLIFYNKNISDGTLAELNDLYMGCYKCFRVHDKDDNGEDFIYSELICDSYLTKDNHFSYKKALEEKIGEEIELYITSCYGSVPQYEKKED